MSHNTIHPMTQIKRTLRTACMALLLAFGVHGLAQAQAITTASASHDVTLEVLEINTISLTDANVSLVIDADDAPAAGTQIYSESATTSYSLSTNGSNKKLIGSMDVAPSSGNLSVSLSAPSTGISRGNIELSTVSKDLVTSVARVAGSALTMQYTYSVNVSEGTMASETKTVTYSILDA